MMYAKTSTCGKYSVASHSTAQQSTYGRGGKRDEGRGEIRVVGGSYLGQRSTHAVPGQKY